MTINICTKFHVNLLDGIKLIERTRFSFKKNSKKHDSVINVGGVCTSSDSGFYLYKLLENILDDIKVIEGTRFL